MRTPRGLWRTPFVRSRGRQEANAPSATQGMLLGMHPRATLAATILGSSLAIIDGSVVNVALPAVAENLKMDPSILPWIITAYLLPLGALTLLGGALGDHFGLRRCFHLGLTAFTLGSVACAVAPSSAWL